MKDYTHKQEQNLFTDEERTKIGLHSREALTTLNHNTYTLIS